MIGGKQHTGGLWLMAAALAAAATVRADLAPTSPFLPAGTTAQAAGAGPSGPIELRGLMSGPDGTAFCIYDTAKKKDIWVGLNETGHDFVVKSADASSDTVTVAYQGRLMKLDLHTAKVGAAAATTGGAAVVANPSPADEQRRLDAVAQEVRRRRAERERAAGEAPGPGVPGVPGAPGGPGGQVGPPAPNAPTNR